MRNHFSSSALLGHPLPELPRLGPQAGLCALPGVPEHLHVSASRYGSRRLSGVRLGVPVGATSSRPRSGQTRLRALDGAPSTARESTPVPQSHGYVAPWTIAPAISISSCPSVPTLAGWWFQCGGLERLLVGLLALCMGRLRLPWSTSCRQFAALAVPGNYRSPIPLATKEMVSPLQ